MVSLRSANSRDVGFYRPASSLSRTGISSTCRVGVLSAKLSLPHPERQKRSFRSVLETQFLKAKSYFILLVRVILNPIRAAHILENK